MKTACLYLLISILAMLFTACEKDAHEGEIIIPEGNGGLAVGLQAEGTAVPVKSIHLFLFGADDHLAAHQYFADPREMALQTVNLPTANYTLVAVANAPEGFMPPATRPALPDVTLPDFIERLAAQAQQQPDLLTGMMEAQLEEGKLTRVTLTLKEGIKGISAARLHLVLTLPSPNMPDYTAARTRTAAGYTLRGVAEVYRAGTGELALRRQVRLIPVTTQDSETNSVYTLDLVLKPGDYDLRFWADYVPADAAADHHYITSAGLTSVRIAQPYTASSDDKDAFYAYQPGLRLSPEGQTSAIALQRPLAKYRLVATDIARYRSLMQTNGYPPLEQLTVTVLYEGYFPSSFNAVSGKPNDAATGLFYASPLPTIAPDDTQVQAAADWVLVNGTESAVTASVRITDNQGREWSRVGGIVINYRRGYLTTLRGEFLTAGKSGGGIHIDTEWDDEFVVEF